MKHHHGWLGLLIFLGMICMWTTPVHALENQYLNDHTNTLTEGTLKDAETINDTLARLPGKPTLSMEVYDRIPKGQDIDKFKVKRFEQLGIGQKGWDNGLYFVLALRDKKYALEVGYGLEAALPDGAMDHIVTDAVKTSLRKKHYDMAMTAVMVNISTWLADHKSEIATPAQIKARKAAAHAQQVRDNIAVAIFLGLAVLVVGLLIWQHKRQHAKLLQVFDQQVATRLPLFQSLLPAQQAAYRKQLSVGWFKAMPQDLEDWLMRDFAWYIRYKLADLAPSVPTPMPAFAYAGIDYTDLPDSDELVWQAASLQAYFNTIQPHLVRLVAPFKQYFNGFSEWAPNHSFKDQQEVWAAFVEHVTPQDAKKLHTLKAQKQFFEALWRRLNQEDTDGLGLAMMPVWISDVGGSASSGSGFGSGSGYGGGSSGGGGFSGGW
ncbi:TPM domain-containing protein [Lacticaseibacillus porcinae]|uniref:TPM domain-containing protein n=1 Tax=Lacticaseibacillus porcinae TaxID=1123687 RepID=UPI001786671D|nr:TPM domain-containing protein [Lacticaseibacillus porcinae]